MIFKFKFSTLVLAMASMVFFTSCDDDDEVTFPSPTIANLEVGIGNSLTAPIGGFLHMDAEIVAEGTIDRIMIDIHKEDGTGEDIEMTYTNYSGQKNADFHEDLDIPATATEGEYHFHIKVIDQQGQTKQLERDIMIVASSSTAPEIEDLEIGENDNHTATIGGELDLDAHIHAHEGIDHIEVDMHNEDGTGDDIEVEWTNYEGLEDADFHEHVEIPATATPGEYHFHFKVVDQAGQVTEIDADVTIEQ
ncbi:MAG: DUF4625 domain-containing protein [Bacteroidota bacterium]